MTSTIIFQWCRFICIIYICIFRTLSSHSHCRQHLPAVWMCPQGWILIHLASPLAYTRLSCLFCGISIKMCKHLLDLITIGKVWEKTMCLGKNPSTHHYDLYGTMWNTFAVCLYKKVYTNECLGGIHYRMGFAWKVSFLLNKDTLKKL